MFSSDLEKGAGAHASSEFDHNTSSHPVSGDFPPKYESQVNIEMQRFGEAQPQAPKIVDIDYDTLAPSQRKQGKLPMWLYAIVASSIVAMVIGAVIIAVHVANQKRHDDTQTAVITRSEPDASRASMTMSPALQPVSRAITTVTIQPITSTVYLTVTPPAPSTTTVMVVPSESTSLSTPVMTVVSTMAGAVMTVSVTVPTVVATSTLGVFASTSAETSSTSSASVSLRFKGFDGPLLANGLTSVMSGVTLSTSTEAETSTTTETSTTAPTTETVVSITTDLATETVSEEKIPIVSTAHPFLYRCSVPGMACG